ncbi:MAG: hypothetical protein Q8L57_01130, partial [bacterium]|nr:hypothetical protein [bacterium]
GFDFKLPRVVKILTSLGFKVSRRQAPYINFGKSPKATKTNVSRSCITGQGDLIVEIPTLRLDVELPEDLIEEVLRVFGYQNIPGRLPEAILVPPQKNDLIEIANKIRTQLSGQGFFEVYNYSFAGERELRDSGSLPSELLELENPASRDFQYLRNSLFVGLLENAERNLKNFREIKIFEIGKVFEPGRGGEVIECWRFSGLISRKDRQKIPGEFFYELKGALDQCLDGLGIAGRWYDNIEPTAELQPKNIWNLARSAEIKVGKNEEIGFLGEINGAILEKFGIEAPAVAAFDFDLEKLLELAQAEREYAPISKYPAVIRDIAILVAREVRIAHVLNVIYGAGVKYIEDVDLFDIYEDEAAFSQRKSLAFHLIFQARDRTLSDAEV